MFRRRTPKHRKPKTMTEQVVHNTPAAGIALGAIAAPTAVLTHHAPVKAPTVLLPDTGPMAQDIFDRYTDTPSHGMKVTVRAHKRVIPKHVRLSSPKPTQIVREVPKLKTVPKQHHIRHVTKNVITPHKNVTHKSVPQQSAPKGSWATVESALRSQLGVPYVYGGETPGRGFDCSGLTQWAFAKVGIHLPRTAADQVSRGLAVRSPKPGDLIFWGSPATHVAVYIGGGKMIAAPHTGTVVKVESVYGSPYYRRVL